MKHKWELVDSGLKVKSSKKRAEGYNTYEDGEEVMAWKYVCTQCGDIKIDTSSDNDNWRHGYYTKPDGTGKRYKALPCGNEK